MGEIEAPDNLSPSSLKELNKHRPLPVVPMNFLTVRQETRAGATGSKMLAALCELGVKVRSGAGPITFFPGRPQVSGCQLVGLRSAGEEEGRKRTGKGRKARKGKRKRGRGKERSRDTEREKKKRVAHAGEPRHF